MRTLKSRRHWALIGSALPMLLIGSLQADSSLAAERPDFSGSWQLNQELSESPSDKMKEARGSGRGGRGGSGGGKGGGGMRGGGGFSGRDAGSREDMQARFQAMTERVETLDILHQDPEMVIGFADDSSRTLFTDGRQIEDVLEIGVFDSKGKWKNNSQVVIKSESSNGGDITQIYELNETGDMLFVTTNVKGDGRRPSISFRRIYDRVLVEIPTNPESDDSAG